MAVVVSLLYYELFCYRRFELVSTVDFSWPVQTTSMLSLAVLLLISAVRKTPPVLRIPLFVSTILERQIVLVVQVYISHFLSPVFLTRFDLCKIKKSLLLLYTKAYTNTIHSFITEIYIAPLQGHYSEALPTLAWLKKQFCYTAPIQRH